MQPAAPANYSDGTWRCPALPCNFRARQTRAGIRACRAERGTHCAFRRHRCGGGRGACTFHILGTARYARGPREARRPVCLPRPCAAVLLAPSTELMCVLNWPPSYLFERSADGGILTSPSGPSGWGEVRITQAERSDCILPGRRGAGPRRRRTAPELAGSAL